MTNWHVYIVLCRDKTLYTGITKNLEKRIKEHNTSKKGAKYTRGRRPVKLVYSEQFGTRVEAARREAQIKKMPRAQKKGLIRDNG